MPALTKFFFRAPYAHPTTTEIVRWWEARRPLYNLAVLAAGVTSLAVVYLAEALTVGRTPSIPWMGIVVYGVLANLFYAAGPIVDAYVTRKWGGQYSAVGPALFRYGFAFAVGLTLLPVAMVFLRVILVWLFGIE